ncbi:hypothetical protein [uncultured Shewanella sp.]|uniref:hypothetical protein n=1 Tax=uncultured Shewanella sp. TaxID=173975 RepID=UPI002612C787|nr:hypothetical protein [uncultured Shewanella sp.]
MNTINIKQIQQIDNKQFEQLKTTNQIIFNDRTYTVNLDEDGEFTVDRQYSGIGENLLRPLIAIKDFFGRMSTSGESATETRAQQLTRMINDNTTINLSDIKNKDGVTFSEGANRDVYIDSEGNGYKVTKKRTNGRDVGIANTSLRLNDIYSNPNFYGGKYAHLATNEVRQAKDISGEKMTISTFKVIQNSENLQYTKKHGGIVVNKPYEKIPESALQELRNAGFQAWDVKPDNFVKIKNELGGYDYLPIDSKYIGTYGRNRHDSVRTNYVEQNQLNTGKQYAFDEKYVNKYV